MGGMPPMSPMAGMEMGGMPPNYMDQMPYMPKKSDRSYRRRTARYPKQQMRRGRTKKLIRYPVYINKSL